MHTLYLFFISPYNKSLVDDFEYDERKQSTNERAVIEMVKTSPQKYRSLIVSNFSFSHTVYKSHTLQRRQKAPVYWKRIHIEPRITKQKCKT